MVHDGRNNWGDATHLSHSFIAALDTVHHSPPNLVLWQCAIPKSIELYSQMYLALLSLSLSLTLCPVVLSPSLSTSLFISPSIFLCPFHFPFCPFFFLSVFLLINFLFYHLLPTHSFLLSFSLSLLFLLSLPLSLFHLCR